MKKVIAYVHSHWDREWYREFEEFRLRLIEVFTKVLNDLDSNKLPAFYFDGQTAAIEDYLEIFPEKADKIKQLIEKEKLFVGPFYCSSDEFLTSAESLVRNLYFGIKKSKELGCNDFIAYLSDTFGHSPSTAYILKSFGIDKAVLWRGLSNLPADIKWEGIDAIKLIQGYFQDFLSLKIPPANKARFLKKYLNKISAKSPEYLLLPIGADHLAAPININHQIKKISQYLPDYEIEVKTPFEYFEKTSELEKPEVKGEFLSNDMTFILPGVYSSRIYLKQQNARLQWLLSRIAEPLQALSAFNYGSENRQNQCDYAYKTLIKNHAHDSIYGCSIDSVHREMMTRFHNVKVVSDGIVKRTIRDISSDNNILSVFNLSNYNYSGVVKIKTANKVPKIYNPQLIDVERGFTDEKLYNIQQIPVTEDIAAIKEYLIDVKNIPAFSVKSLDRKDICRQKCLKTSENSIENEFIKFEILKKKIVITDKVKDEIYEDFINVIDRADIGDSYNFGALKSDKPLNAKIKGVELLESGPQRALIKFLFEFELPEKSTPRARSKKLVKHKLSVNVILYNRSEYVEFEINWVNKSKNHILQVEFNLNEPITSTVSEDSLGLINREFDPGYDIYKKIPAKKGKELKTNTRPMQRFVWAQNVGLITEGLNEYEISQNKLRLTILRATGTISNPENPTRGTPAGPPLLTPELQCIGDNEARFALAFSEKPDKLFELSERFYGAQMAFFADVDDESIIKLSNKNILVYAIKLSGKGLVLRLFNLSDDEQVCSVSTDIRIKSIYEITPLEEILQEIVSQIEFKSKEMKTIKLVR